MNNHSLQENLQVLKYFENDQSSENSFNKESNFLVICIPELKFTLLFLQYLNMAALKIKWLHNTEVLP